MSAGVLLLEDEQGNTVGVRFPDSESAYEWADKNAEGMADTRGWVQVVSRTEAKRCL